ncbi:MAG: Asp/Glu racemase [Gammaproteobacteria bacterium]|nr:Asp/Glu racemase [Gammaproteobacteria bacterium]
MNNLAVEATDKTRSPVYPSRGLARIGIIVPVSNTNLEPDMALLRPEGVSLHFARAGGYDLDQVPDGEQMRKFALATLDDVVDSINATQPDVILYGCTSATLAHGPKFDQEFTQRIQQKTGVPTITAAGALVDSLNELGVTDIAFSSPYVESLNAEAIQFLADSGFNTVSSAYVGSDLGNYGQSALTPDQVFDLGARADSPDAQAIVLSCTDMRAVEIIEPLQDTLGKPVVCSNGALMQWAKKQIDC